MGTPLFETWDYQEQTKRKHLVFEDYFDKWIKILGKYKSLNYIDCFGGLGAYNDNGKLQAETVKLYFANEKEHLNIEPFTNIKIRWCETPFGYRVRGVFSE